MDEIKKTEDKRCRRLLVNERLDIKVLPWRLEAKCPVKPIVLENIVCDQQKMLF